MVGGKMEGTCDAELVSKLFANGPGVWTDEGALRVKDKSKWRVMIMSTSALESQLLYEIETV
jgi:hypothetical protein